MPQERVLQIALLDRRVSIYQIGWYTRVRYQPSNSFPQDYYYYYYYYRYYGALNKYSKY